MTVLNHMLLYSKPPNLNLIKHQGDGGVLIAQILASACLGDMAAAKA